MRRFIAFGPALVVLITTLVTLVAAPAAVRMVGYAQSDAKVQLARQTLDQEDILERVNRQVRAIADAVSPSVVHIRTQESPRRGYVRQGQGSGWMFDMDGHVVTNSHVVKGAQMIRVQFQDGRQVDADVVGRDAATDIAVLKVRTSEGFSPVVRATGERLHQGDRVYAFGSPFGFKFSMSEGIVSGLGRDPRMVIGMGGYTNFIQTDAAVNPGNSGGPLVDVKGRLVGMNVAIATASNADGTSEGQSAGISFAIPLDTIEFVVSELISKGVVVKGYLGITHPGGDEDNSAALARMKFNGHGVLVTDVAEDGPAASVGMKARDVITSFNGEQIFNVPGLRAAISNSPSGRDVEIKVSRDGTEMTFRPQLSSLPPTEIDESETWETIQQFGIGQVLRRRDGRLVITDVFAGSPAEKAGVIVGQIVSKVNGEDVRSRRDFVRALALGGVQQGKSAEILVTDESGENSRKITITPVR